MKIILSGSLIPTETQRESLTELSLSPPPLPRQVALHVPRNSDLLCAFFVVMHALGVLNTSWSFAEECHQIPEIGVHHENDCLVWPKAPPQKIAGTEATLRLSARSDASLGKIRSTLQSTGMQLSLPEMPGLKSICDGHCKAMYAPSPDVCASSVWASNHVQLMIFPGKNCGIAASTLVSENIPALQQR